MPVAVATAAAHDAESEKRREVQAMAELMRLQTGFGKLIVTDNSITLERPGFPSSKVQSIMRSAITSVESKQGFTGTLIIHSQGADRMEIKGLKVKDLDALLDLLR
jgi:hypothetical protein